MIGNANGKTIIGINGSNERVIDNGSFAVVLEDDDIKNLLKTIDLKHLEKECADRHTTFDIQVKKSAILDDCMYIIQKQVKLRIFMI